MNYDVIIPCYNAEQFIEQTINSIRAQTRPAARIIAVDDGSTDRTYERLRDLLPSSDLDHQENRGPGAACMAAIQKSDAPVVAFIDADDLWRPHKMDRQMQSLAAAIVPTVHFAGLCSFSDDNGASLTVNQDHAGWSRSTMVVKRDVFNQIGPIVDTPSRTGEMVDWISRAREMGVALDKNPEVLGDRRLHAGSLTRRTTAVEAGYLTAARLAVARRRQAKRSK